MNKSIFSSARLLRRAAIAALRGALMFALLSALLAAPAQLAQAQTYSVLYSFCSQPNCADGASPYAGLVLDNNKPIPNLPGEGFSLYGTTIGGGRFRLPARLWDGV